MGDYGSDDDRKKKKKSRKYSRSPTDSVDSRSSSRRSKHRRRRDRSRTRSRDRKSKTTRRSRSDSRSRRSRSPRKSRRSRDRYRSRSRGRRSYSRSRGSRSRSYRSRSRSRRRSRSRSYGRKRQSRSRSKSLNKKSGDLLSQSLADMSPNERTQARMQLAIEKAMAADEAIRQRHGVEAEKPADTKKRQDAIVSIESDGFTQQKFKTGKANPDSSSKTRTSEFSFGTSLDYVKSSALSTDHDTDSLMHPRFSEDPDKRKSRWLERLKALREELTGS